MAKQNFDDMFASSRKTEDAAKEKGTAAAVASTIGKVVGNPFEDDGFAPETAEKKESEKEKKAPAKEAKVTTSTREKTQSAKKTEKRKPESKPGRKNNRYKESGEPGTTRGIWLTDEVFIALKNDANINKMQLNEYLEMILRERYKLKK